MRGAVKGHRSCGEIVSYYLMGTLSVPTEHGLTTFWVSLRAALSHTRFPPTHRSSLYRSSLVGTVICARQLFGDNTVLPHYESHTVNLTKSYSLGLGPGEGGCKGP